ncbi:signal recognition particle-docking protein FtsY [[Mycoplasma] mobile]|uniref:Signal recognition particle receptor FtsY n=1 Tax=Mycoplasma mobile (strain ATCC 43663 / 163K / NCTC 11711) TaxID=267748 RepID=Q6KIF2_MYCM1|nr:signal recognition particle-docking protein FtsY [[Mycoplasma] mobile]AAT27624.1 cell division protein ftsY [Mycoplasma mobile 163K]
MGFFKKLKERLFGSELESKKNQNVEQNIEELFIKNKIEENILDKDQSIELELEKNNASEIKTVQTNSKKSTSIFTKIFSRKTNNDDSISKKELKLNEREKEKNLTKLEKENKINKYIAGLDKSSSALSTRVMELQNRYNKIDDDFFEELEEILIMSDISVNLVFTIIEEIKKVVKIENVSDPKLIGEIIADKLFVIYTNNSIVDTNLKIEKGRLNVILMVGVNGSGKTTTIAKLANMYKQKSYKILIAAGDTFRAGAVEQLGIWANRLEVDIVKPDKEGQDPSSVVFKAMQKAKDEIYDLLIIDTAGRLQNKVNLMNELAKINQTISRFLPEAPHESLLVLDATNGQNALSQASAFKEVTPLSGIVLTKMDGTSKGGIIISIKDLVNIDVKLLGLGEKMDDLQEFDLDAFIYGLTKDMVLENYSID